MIVVIGLLWVGGVVLNFLALTLYTVVTSLQAKDIVWSGGQTFWAISVGICALIAIGLGLVNFQRSWNSVSEGNPW